VWVWLVLIFGAGFATGVLVAVRRAKKKAATVSENSAAV
jgi:hypothetical protein